MAISAELLQKAKGASSAEELQKIAKEKGIDLTQSEAETYYKFLHESCELSDDELDQVAGGKETKYCTTSPTPLCTGLFLYGLDGCSNYVEMADPSSMPTAYTYPVLCTCLRGHFKDFPMNRRYQE